ncbi:hypothetical protein BGZ96_001079 [Linnemannia gamsii]|uniref:Nucleolar 27S pre-rRNA processing Urb2/Npa2 C-terminal domain-containing protein n=1 Tax=Linnemannia gamsii TaxID=64522 RepID=A0ABQ7K9F7_9FUNG|nr:hypothetical protein BGZ96_001079 [Linnemannia gamsii]
MEEYLSSSEAFAKALKGLQTSPSDKIRLANEAWRRQDVVLPHKQEFLLEWLCSTLVKAATPSKNPKDTSSSTITDQAHWDLFKDMLTKITHSRKLHRKYGHIAHSRHAQGNDNHVIEAQAPSVLLRVPVIPMFTALVQKLCPTTVTTTAQPAKSKKNNKGAEATNPPTTPITTSSPTEIPSASVLESASICFNILSGPLMTEWFQPTLEQYTPLVQATLEALIEMTQDSSKIDACTKEILMAFAHIILDRFKRLVVIQPNQKKVFGLIAGKMFEALVRARVAIRVIPGTLQEECQKAIGALLRTGLFHQEHLQEYTTGYVAGDEKSIQSYQKQLFEQIATMTKSTHSTAVLDVLPVLVQCFVEESRRKQRSMANSGFERGIESAREVEFSFFKIIYMLAKRQLPNLTGEPSESSIDQLANIMDAHNNLLSAILDLNMYQPSNNEAADQYVFMSASFGSIYSCLTTAQTLNNGRLQSISLSGIVVLAQLDDRLLKPHLDSLWPILLCPLSGAHDAALELVKTLLEIYGKSSDLQIFLPSLLSSLRGFINRPQELHSSPLFTRAFLDLIPGNIRGYLPLPQAPKILDIFMSELMALDTTGMEIDGLEPLQETTHKKKRKLNSGKSKGGDEQDASSSMISSSELVITLFIQFLKGLRITVNQEKQLNNEFKVVFDHFLNPTFERLARIDNSEADTSATYQSRRITPALKLHYALCRVSTQYWAHGLSMDVLEKIVGTFKATSGWTDAAVLCLNRVVLQHVHRTLCSSQGMDDSLAQRCNELVRFTMKASKLKRLLDDGDHVTETWDGHLETATGPKFLVASWQIQVNDWLDIICRFGTTQHMELIATVISRQFVLSSDNSVATTVPGSLDINLLNQVLLRSANFYEVPNFRPIFAQKILEGLSESITALSETAQETKLAATISSFTTQSSAHKEAKSTFAEALKELVDVTAHQRTAGTAPKTKSKKGSSTVSKAAGEHGPKLLSQLSIMHLLPLEYFEKYERNIILTTMAVLDFYIQHRLGADETGIQCLLLERRISNSIMSWRSDAGVLFNDPAILMNLLHYPAWNCSTAYGREDKNGLGHAIIDTTSVMIDSAIRFYMGQTYDERQYEAAYKHFEALFKSSLSWAGDALETSVYSTRTSSTVELKSGQMTESRIKVVLLSQACHSLVQAFEQHNEHTRKSKSKAKKASSKSDSTDNGDDASNDMEARREMVINEIGKLFDTVEAKITFRIQKVVELLKGKKRVSVEEEAQKCLDHFELLKTVVDYRQLTSAQDGDRKAITSQSPCLKLVPDLFQLAKTLAHVQDSGNKTGDQGRNIAHLTALLTAYSCEYLPISKAWSSSEATDKETLTELLALLLDVSGHALEDKDIAKLKDAYLSMLGQLSGDLFENLLNWFLDKAYRSSSTVDELVLVRYLNFTFLGVHHTQKRKVRRQISKLLTRLTQILQTTTSVQVVVGVLDMVASICCEPSFELRSWEIGLALEGVISLMSPATPLLLSPPTTTSSSSSSLESVALTNQDTSKIFTALYHVLINIARFRQEELLSQIPVFTSILQGCFHGFKSLHGSIAKRQQGVESLLKSPFMLLSAGATPLSVVHGDTVAAAPAANTKKESASTPAANTTADRVPIIGDPLPVECAENFARLLTTLGSKPVTTYNNSSSNNNSIDLPSTTPTTGNSSITTDASKAFGKHIPYLLMEYFTIQSSVTASIRQQPLRNALLPGLYALMNLCTDYERELMMSGLDNTGKVLLKGLYTDYLKYHKYTGR